MSTTPRWPPLSPRSVAVPILTLMLALGTFEDAAAQALPIAPGDTVRVTVAGKKTVYEVARSAPGSIVVRKGDGELELSTGSMQRMERRAPRTRGRQIANDAFVAGLAGATAGAILGLADGDDPPGCWLMCMTAGEKAMLGGAGLGVAGAGAGAILGAIRPLGTRWESVGLDRVGFGVAPVPGGAKLAITWRP
jgi:hypothetical protein